jgi:hypothetical protein
MMEHQILGPSSLSIDRVASIATDVYWCQVVDSRWHIQREPHPTTRQVDDALIPRQGMIRFE